MLRLWLLMMLLSSFLSFSWAIAQDIETEYLPITLENIEQLEQIAILEFDLDGTVNAISQLAFHPTQHLLFSQEYNETVRVWDIERFEFIESLPLPTEYSTAFAISPDGENMVYGGWDYEEQPNFSTLNLWNLENYENQLIIRDWQFSIKEIAYNSDGLMFAAYGWQHDGQIRLWSSDDLTEPIRFPGHGDNVSHIAFTADNRLITSGEDREVRIWNLETQEIEDTLDGYYFVLHPSEPVMLVSSNEIPGDELSTTMFDLEQLNTSIEHDIGGLPFAFNPTGDIVAITQDAGVWLCDFETGEKLVKVSNVGSHVITFSPDGRFVATIAGLGAIFIWAVPTN